MDTAALEAAAREFARLSDELSRFGTVHETSSTPDQPSGKAVSALVASADHMTGVCADKLLGLGRTGPIPGLRADQQSMCPSATGGASPADPFTFGRSDQPCVATADAVLGPGQKLTNDAYGTTCVVGEGKLTACIDTWTNHGFVLQPSGSWAF